MKTTTRDIARSGNVYLIPLLQTFRRIDAGYCRPFSHLSLLSTGTSLDVAPATRPSLISANRKRDRAASGFDPNDRILWTKKTESIRK